MLNLVAHHEQMKLETSLWILISAACHLRTLQISGYLGAAKLKVFYDQKTFQKVVNVHPDSFKITLNSQPSTSLTDDELYIGGLCFHVFELLQFNMHGITEATDHIESEK